MNDNVFAHPYRDLMMEAKYESDICGTAEARKLQGAIFSAVQAYSDYLERHGLIWEYNCYPDDPDFPRMRAQALTVTLDYGQLNGIEIVLRDGAVDRVFGNGQNPDPAGEGPPDIPHNRGAD